MPPRRQKCHDICRPLLAMMLTLSGYANEYGRRQGRDGGTEGEIALIFAAEIELLLGSFAAAPPPEERLSGYLICIGIPSSSAALATAFPVSTRKEGRSARALATELGLYLHSWFLSTNVSQSAIHQFECCQPCPFCPVKSPIRLIWLPESELI